MTSAEPRLFETAAVGQRNEVRQVNRDQEITPAGSEEVQSGKNSETDQAKSEAIDAKSDETKSVREIDLLASKLDETWSYFSSDSESKLSDAWELRTENNRRLLICKGNPKGFLSTKALYSNFKLTFEWKYVGDPNSNSGVLIYTQKEPRLWPTAIQVQLHQPLAGAIFPGGDAKSDNSTEPPQGLAKPIGEWNTCIIESESGKLSVVVNGRKAGDVSGCQPSTGFIALQCEGAETHFRKLRLQITPPPEASTTETTLVDDDGDQEKPPETQVDPSKSGTNDG